MKKFITTLIAIFVLCCTAQANQTHVNFVYVHGSDQGTIEEFDV